MISLYGKEITVNNFPDGTLSTRVEIPDRSTSYTHFIHWRYESEYEMPILFFLTKHLQSKGLRVGLNIPYLPNARMDRVKNDDEIFTLKYFCEFINSLNFAEVGVLDPHSNVSCALIDRLTVYSPKLYIDLCLNAIGKDVVMFYPDEGAMKRYSEMFPGKPYAFGIKNRDWRTGEIKGYSLVNEELVKGKDILIVDDICSKGGTFYHSAKALKNAGANDVFLFITHCENTIAKGNLLTEDLVNHIYTTNSIYTGQDEKITVFEI